VGLTTLAVLAAPAKVRAQEEVWRTPPAGPAAPAPAEDNAGKEPAPPGQAALERARSAWDKGDFDVAEPLYAEAVDKGGLAPADVLEAYVHLGSARAVLGKKAGAVAAFKAAALLDPAFRVPPDAGKRATSAADQARRATRTGPLVLQVDIPDHVAANGTPSVDVSLDPAHAALPGSRIGVAARGEGGVAGAPYVESVRSSRTAHFDLPPSLSVPSTTLRVRVDLLDPHANRLASAEQRVHVQPLPNTAALAPLPLPVAGSGAATAHDDGKHRDFWHTPWPYILGGAALAAGGVAIYFATRPPNDVNVTGVHVMTN
jgi:hypothetical protein